MNIPADIEEIQGLLDVMIERISSLLNRWTIDDEEVRKADALACLHRMAWLLTKAEYLCDSLEDSFPPYPMNTHEQWKKNIKNLKRNIEDFKEEIDAHPGKGNDHQLKPYVNIDVTIGVKSNEMLELIYKCCGDLMECILGIQQSLKQDEKKMAAQYSVAFANWGRTYWTEDSEKGKFKNTLHKCFEARIESDQKPTSGMFDEQYQSLFHDFVATEEGKLWSECPEDPVLLSKRIVSSQWNDHNLNRLFLGLYKLGYLKKKIDQYTIITVTDNKEKEVPELLKYSIFRTISSLLSKIQTSELLSDGVDSDKPTKVFETLLFGVYEDDVEQNEQKQLWLDLAFLETKNIEGDLRLNRFLHVIGRMAKNKIFRNVQKKIANTMFPNAPDDTIETLRVYVQKGKEKDGVNEAKLSETLKNMIDALCV